MVAFFVCREAATNKKSPRERVVPECKGQTQPSGAIAGPQAMVLLSDRRLPIGQKVVYQRTQRLCG